MLDLDSILRLYSKVLHDSIVINAVPTSEIRAGVQSMAHVYSPDNGTFDSSVLQFANFNDIACRCAYLHKYAPLHTYIVFDAMLKILHKELARFRKLISDGKAFEICSLGGGPGSDVIGVLAAFNSTFSSLRASVTIIDCMEKWCLTFTSVIQELKFGGYGNEWWNNFKWNYIAANLLCDMPDKVIKSIGAASLITMVKFISASICTNTEDMVNKIFRLLKPGALVLYIDNAAGGFTQLIQRASINNGLSPVFGPLRHAAYEAEALKIDRFGYTSCFKTKVTIILLQKSCKLQNITRPIPSYLSQNAPIAQHPDSLDFVVLNNNASKKSTTNINRFTFPAEVGNTWSVVNKNMNLTSQKPNSSSAPDHYRLGVSKKNSISTRPSESSTSTVNILPARADNLNRTLQKPITAVQQQVLDVTNACSKPLLTSGSWSTAVQQQISDVTDACSKPLLTSCSLSSNVNVFHDEPLDVNKSFRKDHSTTAYEQNSPNVSNKSPKSPNRNWRSSYERPHPCFETSAIQYVQPSRSLATENSEPVEENEEMCCSCCVIS